MEVLNVTFATAVRCPNLKNELFLAADKTTKLAWDATLDALVITQEGREAEVLVFRTNISHITKKSAKKTKKVE